jgi:hypothetical protein
MQPTAIKVKQPDSTTTLPKTQKSAAGGGLKAVRILVAELPLCQDCKEKKVTAAGMKYCEACK